jgi:CRISPR system Cascade subunit CasE
MSDVTSSQSPLFMAQLWFDLRRLVELGRALHLPVQRVDDNYITHCALRELFGEHTPTPFSVEDNNGKYLRLLGYSSLPMERLQEVAKAFAGPMVYQIPDWPKAVTKPMPSTFKIGFHLGFEVRVCPVIRKSGAGKYHRAGAEVDAFLSRIWEVDEPTTPIRREDVYRDWLHARLSQAGAARLDSVHVKEFSLERMFRRDHAKDRKASLVKRPVAVMTGNLEVTDSKEFTSLLRQGIGRHKSFGFGMLKIRRPQ